MEMERFQHDVELWLQKCFGHEIMADKIERNYRFFEEATELVQACGMSKEDCYRLIEYVYARPKGDIEQEVGGVLVTLSGLVSANEIKLAECAKKEIASCYERIDNIRAKQAAKTIKNWPLP